MRETERGTERDREREKQRVRERERKKDKKREIKIKTERGDGNGRKCENRSKVSFYFVKMQKIENYKISYVVYLYHSTLGPLLSFSLYQQVDSMCGHY